MLFYFLFHFQPQFGPIFINYMMEALHFSQTQIGFANGAGIRRLLRRRGAVHVEGRRWQERFGMRKLFRIYIVVGAVVSLTQFALLEPWFSAITGALSRALPFMGGGTVRVGFLCAQQRSCCARPRS